MDRARTPSFPQFRRLWFRLITNAFITTLLPSVHEKALASYRYRRRQTTPTEWTDDNDRRQQAKQYWPIRRASNNKLRAEVLWHFVGSTEITSTFFEPTYVARQAR